MESGSQVLEPEVNVEGSESLLRPSDSQVYEPSEEVKPAESQFYESAFGEEMMGTVTSEVEERGITFEDIFGTEFDETQFEGRKNVNTTELVKIANETKNTVQRLEEEEHIANELAKAFGQDEELNDLLNLENGEDLINTEVVHNVELLSAPDGKKLNPFASRNKYLPTASTTVGNMPILDNYQCLHFPINNRKISVTDKWDIPVDRRPIQAGLQGAGQTLPGSLYSPQNVIRWKKRRGTMQSNARLLIFDNGDKVLRVGTDYFLIETADAAHENIHLMGAHGSVLLEYMKLRQRWRIRPLRKVGPVINSTIEEKQRKEREDTMPTAPVKRVEQFVPGRTSSTQREENFEAMYKDLEETINYNPSQTGRREAPLVEDEEGHLVVDDNDDVESVAVSEAVSEGGKRALAAQEGEIEVVRQPKKRR